MNASPIDISGSWPDMDIQSQFRGRLRLRSDKHIRRVHHRSHYFHSQRSSQLAVALKAKSTSNS